MPIGGRCMWRASVLFPPPGAPSITNTLSGGGGRGDGSTTSGSGGRKRL